VEKTDRIFFVRCGHDPCQLHGTVAGLITAGRRECWGSQAGDEKGHRNDAVPFLFVTATGFRPSASFKISSFQHLGRPASTKLTLRPDGCKLTVRS
jgi:hypothetical protein